MPEFGLICTVVNNGHGSKVLHIAKNHGVRGGTIFLGLGTVKSKLLDFLDIHDERKEIVMMIAEMEIAKTALSALSKEMKFHKAHHGIGFLYTLSTYIGTKQHDYIERNNMEVKAMYNAIYTVVNKGLAEKVVETAQSVGSSGGTIINARGSGINETHKLFSIEIEPEKEVVMIIAKNEITEKITSAIREGLDIDKAGHGILFVVPLNEVYGIR